MTLERGIVAMDNDIKEKLKKLRKKKRNLFVFKWTTFVMIYYIYSNAIDSFIPFINVILLLIGVDKNICSLICNLYEYFFLCISIYLFVFTNLEQYLNDDEIKEVSIKIKNGEKRQKNGGLKEQQRIKLEENKDLINNIVTRFETLPRDKQFEVLNYLKETGRIEGMADSNLDICIADALQGDFEEILFPSFDKNESGYTRKREIMTGRKKYI